MVQVIQQISLLANIPPLNGVQFYIADNRFNSLSNEPSHTARIVPILMLTYMYLRKFTTGKKYSFRDIKTDKVLWCTYLYVILTSGSSLGFMTVLFPFLCFISMRNILVYSLSGGLVVGLCIAYIKNPAFDRIKNLIPILLSLDPDMIRMIDNSGAARINPYIYYFQDLNFLDLKYWFGFGRGYSEPMLIERVLGHKTDLSSGAGGLFPVMFYDYGLIAGLATIYAIGKTTFTKNNKVFIIFWILFISSGDLNSYYQWLYICLGYTCKNAKMFKINNNA